MIVVITGVPGSGKTLYTIDQIRQISEKENRPVFYSGIPELTLGWIEHDPTKWEELPAGAIMVIDECQRVFRPRANGSTVPSYIAAMETHRHKGVDIWLMTQHPMLIDQNIRRLCGRHIHVDRIMGFQMANLSEWPHIKENCDKSKAGADQRKFKYPKDVYKLYKSSELHTHKVRIPSYVYVFFGALALLFGLIYYIYQSKFAPALANASGEKTEQTENAPVSFNQAQPADQERPGRQLGTREYVAQYQPRIPGLAYTAPVYDQATKPTRAPYPAACVSNKDKCTCYSQQATRLEMPDELCRSIAKDGFFVAWDENKGRALERPPAVAPTSAPPVQVASLGGFNTRAVPPVEQPPKAGPGVPGEHQQPGLPRGMSR